MEPFDITAAGGGSVRVVIPADVAREFRKVLDRFVETLRQGLDGKGRFAWTRGLDPLVPPLHRDRARSREFRLAYAAPLRERLIAAAQRVDRQLAVGLTFTLTPADVADWVMVCGHAQSLYVTERWGRKPLKRAYRRDVVTWLLAVQDAVADAAMDHFIGAAVRDAYGPGRDDPGV